MKGDEYSFGVLRLLEPPHGFESRIEVTDVRFQPVGGSWNAWIDKVHECMATGFLKTQENIVMNWTETEDICLNDSLQVFLAQEEVLRRRIQEKFAVAIEDTFLSVAGMTVESLELESGLEVSQ